MTRSIPVLLACAAILAGATACTSTSPEPDEASQASASQAPPSDETSAAGTASEEPEESASTTAPAEESTDTASERPATSSITVDINGDRTVVEPTNVYCSGSPGEIEHIIGKTNNELPLVEVSGSNFAMVKLHQRGAPERTQEPQGIDYGEEWVTFTDSSVGAALLNGSMVCTDWED